MQTHFTLRGLKGPAPKKDALALFSINPCGQAIVFVHGFGGDVIGTWSDFHSLLPREARCAGIDCYFYGHDGLRGTTHSNAAILREFLDELMTDAATLTNTNLTGQNPRDNAFRYNKLLIVAHSLGAPITRRAILDATINKRPWVKRTELLLFAPAHMGAHVADLALDVASGFKWLKLIVGVGRFASPLITELKSESVILRALQADTKSLTKNGKQNRHLLAKKVIFAARERIVVNVRFPGDPPEDSIPDTTHLSVCKPSYAFTAPFNVVKACL